jgi:hypothetical protein
MKLRRACRVAAALAIAVACAVACAEEFPGYGPPSAIPVGTWGGANAGMIVTDTIAHVHLGCTFGNTSAARSATSARPSRSTPPAASTPRAATSSAPTR